MMMTNRRGAGAYARVGVESAVMSADPHQLIVMLFDGAQAAISSAQLHLQDGNRAAKGAAISKAIDIVNNGLSAALDHEKGGEIAANLARLYDYVSRLLLQANLRDDAPHWFRLRLSSLISARAGASCAPPELHRE